MDTPKPKPKRTRIILIAVGGTLALCMICGVIGALTGEDKTPTPAAATLAPVAQIEATKELQATTAPKASPTVEPTSVPTDIPAPTATPDYSAEAKQLQADVIALFAPAEAAAKRVAEHAQAIADGKSYDMVELYSRGKVAAEAWEAVKFGMYSFKPQSATLKEACQDLSLCASRREDAFRALLKWIDSSKASDMATYEDKMKEGERLMFLGLAKIISVAGVEASGPTLAPETVPTWPPAEPTIPEATRRQIFYDLVSAQDRGIGDEEAYAVVADKYDTTPDIVRKIAIEGTMQAWPMPTVGP